MSVRSGVIKWICIILAVVSVCFLLLGTYRIKQANDAATAHGMMLEKESLPYRVELNTTKQLLDELERETKYVSKEAELMVGFLVSAPSDLSYITEKSEAFGFSPILIVDCLSDMAAASELVSQADPAWEVMLYASDASPMLAQAIAGARVMLEECGRSEAGLFFLRQDFMSDSAVSVLHEAGMTGFTVFHSSPESGQDEDGTVYFDYAYIRTNDVNIGRRLGICYAGKVSMLFAFDMAAIRDGAVPEELAVDILTALSNCTQNSDCRFATAAEVKAELGSILATEAAKAAAFASEEAELTARIAELEAIIDAIYQKQAP